jgi:hypothetical protein
MKLSQVPVLDSNPLCLRATGAGVSEIDLLPGNQLVAIDLFVSHNTISDLTHIVQFHSLQRLLISYNNIRHIEDLFPLCKLPSLREVNLEGNPVSRLPLFYIHVFHLLPLLEVLNGRPAKSFPASRLPTDRLASDVNAEAALLRGLATADLLIEQLASPAPEPLAKLLRDRFPPPVFVDYCQAKREPGEGMNRQKYFRYLSALLREKHRQIQDAAAAHEGADEMAVLRHRRLLEDLDQAADLAQQQQLVDELADAGRNLFEGTKTERSRWKLSDRFSVSSRRDRSKNRRGSSEGSHAQSELSDVIIEFHDGEARLSHAASTEQAAGAVVEEEDAPGEPAPADDETNVKSGEGHTSEPIQAVEEVDAKSGEDDAGELRQRDEKGNGKAEEEEAGEPIADGAAADTAPVDLNGGVDLSVQPIAAPEEEDPGELIDLIDRAANHKKEETTQVVDDTIPKPEEEDAADVRIGNLDAENADESNQNLDQPNQGAEEEDAVGGRGLRDGEEDKPAQTIDDPAASQDGRASGSAEVVNNEEEEEEEGQVGEQGADSNQPKQTPDDAASAPPGGPDEDPAMSNGELASALEEESSEQTGAVLFPAFGLISRSFGRWKSKAAFRSSWARVGKEDGPKPPSEDILSRLQDVIERRSLMREVETQREVILLSHARLDQIRLEVETRMAGAPTSVNTSQPNQPDPPAGSSHERLE